MSDLRTTNLLLGVLVALAVGFLLLALRGVVLPLFVAMFLSYLVMPLVRAARRVHVPVGVSVIVILILFGGLLGTLGKLVYNDIAALAARLPEYEAQLRPWLVRALEMARVPEEVIPAGEDSIDWQDLLTSAPVMGYARAGVGNLLGLAGNISMVLLFLVFIVLDRGRESLDRRIVAAFSAEGTQSARPVLEKIHHDIERYLLTKTGISLMTALLAWIVLSVFDVRSAVALAALTFLLNFIPNVGSVMATAFPVMIALVQFGSPLRVIVLALILGSIQFTIGNLLEPWILGRTLRLNPITVLLWLVFWGWLWGVWGMVLAVPLAATTRIILSQTPSLRAVGTLMSEA